MTRLAWLVFLTGLALTALLAMIESPPKRVIVEGVAPLYGGNGSILDNGPWGLSGLYARLVEAGYRVAPSLTLYQPSGGDHLVIIVAWPRLCNTSILAAVAASLAQKAKQLDIIVFDEDGCLATRFTAYTLTGVNITLGNMLTFNGLHAVPLALKDSGLIAIGYTVKRLYWSPLNSCKPIILDPYTGDPVGIECATRNMRIVYVGDSHLPTNTMLGNEKSRAWELIEVLLERLDARNATVIIPVELYPKEQLTRLPLSLVIHPAVIAAYLARLIPHTLQELYERVYSVSPLLPPAVAFLASMLVFLTAAGASIPKRGERAPKPPELRGMLREASRR